MDTLKMTSSTEYSDLVSSFPNECRYQTLNSTVCCILTIYCLPWFFANNCWFKINYLQDQPVNLMTYCVFFFLEIDEYSW